MKAASDSLLLGHRNVYILPTRAGAMLGVTLAVLLVGAINYQLNLGYLLAFLLAGCALAALFHTHATLRGLLLSLSPPEPGVAGQAIGLVLRLKAPAAGARLRPGLDLRIDEPREGAAPAAASTDMEAGAGGEVTVQALPRPRGVHPLPRVRIETRYPLGLFRAWAVWQPAGELIVAPRPEESPPPWPASRPSSHLGAQALRPGAAPGSDGFDGLRPWRHGDALRHIAWRKSAQTEMPVSRDRARDPLATARVWLDWQSTGDGTAEARLSRLAAWVQQADRSGVAYGLRVPATTIEPGRGALHRRRCLEALARC